MKLSDFNKELILDTSDVTYNSPTRLTVNTIVGKLIVLENLGYIVEHNKKIYYYKCKCSCGNPDELIFSEKSLYKCIRGNNSTISCGCAKLDMLIHTAQTMDRSVFIKNRYPDNSPVMVLYKMIRSKTHYTYSKSYEKFGGKGIGMCEDWLGKDGPNNFCDWALENGYQKGDIIKLKDLNKDFSPDNCYFHYSNDIKLIKAPFIINHSGDTDFLNSRN